MSAAERLRALAEARDGYFGVGHSSDHVLVDALPAIIAVVEAAEVKLDAEWREFSDNYYPEDGEDAASPPNIQLAHRRLAEALATLSQALEPEQASAGRSSGEAVSPDREKE